LHECTVSCSSVRVNPLCRLWRVSYVCTLVLLWTGCGISLPKIGHFNIDVISGVLKCGSFKRMNKRACMNVYVAKVVFLVRNVWRRMILA